jgi:hypothetical protein
MMSLTHHIKRVHAQPHHIRRQIAFTLASGLTVLIAFVWLVGSVATGSFAIKNSSFAEASSVVSEQLSKTSAPGGVTGLLGSVSAAFTGATTAPAHIQIVDAGRTSTLDSKKNVKTEATIIPF